MVSHSGLITVMERAARKAAPRIRRDFGEVEQLQVSRKGPADFVSMADRRAEQALVDELRKARPDWGFLLEEAGEVQGDPFKPRWIVDPIDGTSNFLHGIPHFAISIAVQEPKPGGTGGANSTAAWSTSRSRRELLGREGQGRLAPGPAACVCRRAATWPMR
jgi:myo-inositol-1(or 4)-monophosphatase